MAGESGSGNSEQLHELILAIRSKAGDQEFMQDLMKLVRRDDTPPVNIPKKSSQIRIGSAKTAGLALAKEPETIEKPDRPGKWEKRREEKTKQVTKEDKLTNSSNGHDETSYNQLNSKPRENPLG